jgi:hypothetical protein
MEDLSPWQKFKQNQGDAKPWHLIYKENYVSESVLHQRLELCKTCPEFIKITGQCKKCGCVMKLKGLIKQATCPIGKW